jgi:diguanylate cyclase (GGDEF)-like protein
MSLPSSFSKSQKSMFWLVLVISITCFAASAHGQLASPDMGKPDVYQAQIGECQRLSMGEMAQAASLAQSLLSRKDLTPYATIMLTDCLAHAKVVANDFKGATETESRALHLLETSNMPDSVQANIFSNAGGIFQTAGDTGRAATLFHQALAKSVNLPVAKIATLMNIGTLYADVLNDPVSASSYFRQAYELSKSIGQEDVYIDFAYGNTLLDANHYDEALRMLDRVAVLAKGKEIYAGVNGRANIARAKILLTKGDTQQARQLLTNAVSTQRQLNDAQGEAYALVALGNLQLQDKNNAEALASAQRIMDLGQKAHAWQIQVDGMHLAVSVNAALGKTAEALAMAQRVNELEVSQLKAENTRSLAGYETQLKDQTVQLQNEQLQAQAELQALRIKRERQSRNLLIGILLLLVSVGGAFLLYQRRIGRKLHLLSTTDPLCGLLNRREVARILNESRRNLNPSSEDRTGLFLIDVDHFKLVNDKYGHDAGDRVLLELSSRFCTVCRPDDLVARWGGEEFLIGAWRLTPQKAARLAERLRAAAEAEPIQIHEGVSITVTVSIGFAFYPFFPATTESTWRQSVYLADRALYSSKHSGRNAWAGMWGTPGAEGIPMQTIHDDPELAIANGWIEMKSNKNLVWRIASNPVDPKAHAPHLRTKS